MFQPNGLLFQIFFLFFFVLFYQLIQKIGQQEKDYERYANADRNKIAGRVLYEIGDIPKHGYSPHYLPQNVVGVDERSVRVFVGVPLGTETNKFG